MELEEHQKGTIRSILMHRRHRPNSTWAGCWFLGPSDAYIPGHLKSFLDSHPKGTFKWRRGIGEMQQELDLLPGSSLRGLGLLSFASYMW